MKTFGDLFRYATQALIAGEHAKALHAFAGIVQLRPADLDARLRVADTLLAMGEVQNAAVVYTSLARHAANAGYPLRALTAMKILEALEPQLGALQDGLAQLYSVDSDKLGRGARLSLGDPSEELPAGLTFDSPPENIIAVSTQVASSTDQIASYPEKLPPLPIFSELPAASFSAILRTLKLVRARPGQAIISEGDSGTSFFVLSRGDVEVSRKVDEDTSITLATLHSGAIFGEMALVSAQPRTASVTAHSDCDLLEFDRATLLAAAADVPTIAKALDNFARERLLSNLLSTSALFRPLNRTQRYDLARRFVAHDVESGVNVIQEGAAGQGLFVLLHGEVEVSKQDGGGKVELAKLSPGEVFGEIALLSDSPTTATVTATKQSTVLSLSREQFQALVSAIPEIREYVEDLGDSRMMDTRLTMSDMAGDEIDEDDLIMI